MFHIKIDPIFDAAAMFFMTFFFDIFTTLSMINFFYP